jgi:hypothetical protein
LTPSRSSNSSSFHDSRKVRRRCRNRSAAPATRPYSAGRLPRASPPPGPFQVWLPARRRPHSCRPSGAGIPRGPARRLARLGLWR